MIDLGLTRYHENLKFKNEAEKRFIFDSIRKKWLVLQPEEYVRQLVIEYLVREKGYSRNRISIEKGLRVNKLNKRYDVVAYDTEMQPFLLIECKSPKVKINQDVLEQIAWYNMTLKVKCLLATNGLQSYCCQLDYDNQSYTSLNEVPSLKEVRSD